VPSPHKWRGKLWLKSTFRSGLKNEINPGLLFDSFESLIGLIHRSKKEADEFIGHLSAFYRYCLHNRNNDVVFVSEEMKLLGSLLSILNIRYSGQIHLHQNLNELNKEKMLVPCTLLSLVEIACRTNIIDSNQGLNIDIVEREEIIRIKYKLNRRLGAHHDYSSRFEQIKKSYSYFTDVPFEFKEVEGSQYITIPLLTVEESEL
jgi:LytS/YehU family sensor histidine kinase